MRIFVTQTEEEPIIDSNRMNFSSKMEILNEIFWKVNERKDTNLMLDMDNQLETIIDYLNSQISGNLAIS
jgi:hypothetical protein